ncbi:MAG TPA: hypothetical protein VE907_04380 [Gammaproteobacteria bacterium]|nr:hypothetical protein [Gammaproteobacteria bacterium]
MDENDVRSMQAPQAPAPPAVPVFDASKYSHYIEDPDLTDAQKEEFLRTLWWIMAAFVDLGFGVDSVQRVLPGLSELTSEFTANALEPINAQRSDEFNETAALEAAKRGDDGNGS